MMLHSGPAVFQESEDYTYDASRSNALWNEYSAYAFQQRKIDALSADVPSDCLRGIFARQGFVSGQLSDHARDQMTHAFSVADFQKLSIKQMHPQYVKNATPKEQIDRVNSNHRFYAFKSRQLWAMWSCLEELNPVITDVLGGPWRFLCAKAWATQCDVLQDMNDWHTDGFPDAAIKLMIYLSEIGGDGGGLHMTFDKKEFISLQGPIGSWIIFENSKILHRGVGPSKGGKERILIEFTIGPSFETACMPFDAGSFARYPREPWSRIEPHLYSGTCLEKL